MSEFKLEESGLETNETPVGGYDLSNVKRLRAGDGSFSIENGVLRLRDSNGITIIIFDPNA